MNLLGFISLLLLILSDRMLRSSSFYVDTSQVVSLLGKPGHLAFRMCVSIVP